MREPQRGDTVLCLRGSENFSEEVMFEPKEKGIPGIEQAWTEARGHEKTKHLGSFK